VCLQYLFICHATRGGVFRAVGTIHLLLCENNPWRIFHSQLQSNEIRIPHAKRASGDQTRPYPSRRNPSCIGNTGMPTKWAVLCIAWSDAHCLQVASRRSAWERGAYNRVSWASLPAPASAYFNTCMYNAPGYHDDLGCGTNDLAPPPLFEF
jgi:hypothetical protein